MSKVAIVGSGFVGRAWAISFARAGHEVALWDADSTAPAKALAFIAAVLPDLVANGLSGGASPADLMARMKPVADLGEALDGAAHAQENTPEDVAVKREIFARLDRLAGPDVVLASSTSAILPSAFTEALAGRARCLVVHPINPPYLVPAAEVVPAPWTDAGVVERTAAFLRAAGHAPIVMKRELDGFVMNRLQGALLEEAFRLVADGYAGVEDVDVGIREGLALRWSFMGPFETIDLNAPGGVRDYIERYQKTYADIFPSTQRRVDWAGPVMTDVEAERRKRTPADKLGERQAWRDRRLMAWRRTSDERMKTSEAEPAPSAVIALILVARVIEIGAYRRTRRAANRHPRESGEPGGRDVRWPQGFRKAKPGDPRFRGDDDVTVSNDSWR